MKKYLILFLIIAGIILPAVSFAGLPDFNGPLVICGTSTTKDCTLCDIFKTAQKMIDFIIGLLFLAAPILLGVGGFMILLGGANPGQIDKGKKIITSVIIGIIIALLAWTIINMIFNNLVGSTTDSTGRTVGKSFQGPWNEIECTGGGINENVTSSSSQGNYCVCETLVYDLDPIDSSAAVIGTNAKIYLNFATVEECTEKCVKANASIYCHASLKMDQANLYCTNSAGLEGRPACTLKQVANSCQIGNCANIYSSESECLNAITTTFKAKCFLDGQALCKCYTAQQKGVCDYSSNKYVPWQIYKEDTYSSGVDGIGTDLSNCGGTSDTYCRLNCQYQKCKEDIETNVCGEKKDSFNCFDGYQCKQMIESQTTDASTELKQILNCMKGKLNTTDKIITSISDNSPDTQGSLGRCFNPSSNWGLCGSSKDSCGGECCGHSFCSLHYGGKGNTDSNSTVQSTCGIGTADCRRSSWAVDFANGTSLNNLKTAAKDCAEELWDGNMETIYIENEGNHNHLQLDGVAKYHGCK